MDTSEDRIAEPWGSRTPYGRHGEWPTRVDTPLAEDVAPGDVQRWVQAASILHSDGDAMDIAVVDGRMAGVRGRAWDRVNHGRLGPKDLFGWQANASSDRLTRPLVRRDGRLVECDWSTAMDLIVSRSRSLLQRKGPGSIGFCTTGQRFAFTLGSLSSVRRDHARERLGPHPRVRRGRRVRTGPGGSARRGGGTHGHHRGHPSQR